jgi:nitrile hydratase
VLRAADVPRALAAGTPTERAPRQPAAFAIGQRVRTRCGPFDHHVRLPGYLQGRTGTVERVCGAHVYPDTHAHGQGEQPAVALHRGLRRPRTLGAEAQPGLSVCFDAFEPYLEPAAPA